MRKDHEPRYSRGRIALGPTYWARVWPWLRWGAPVVAVIFWPISSIFVRDLPWYLMIPAGWLLAWAVLCALMLVAIAGVHRTTWWVPAQQVLIRGNKRIEVASIERLEPDFRLKGTTFVWPRGAGDDNGQKPLAIAYSGWDNASYEGIVRLQRHLGDVAAASRAELMHRDRLARAFYANRQLADRYGMQWRSEYEDPHVFLEAFDARRNELKSRRR